MLEEFKHSWNNEFDNWRSKEIFLAISGGKDSMALSHILLSLNVRHTLLHCNFQLRGDDSKGDEAFIEAYAKENNLPFHSVRFDTKIFAQENKLTIQEAARKLRYDWFDSFIDYKKQQLLFTAHHGSDTIETFFLNLMRGTGLKGLTGIDIERGYILRPLIPFTVDLIEAYISENNIIYREDKSNADVNYNRNFVRHELIPLIEQRARGFDKKMASTIDSLKSIQSYLKAEATRIQQDLFKETNQYTSVNIQELYQVHDAILEEILKRYVIQRSQLNEFKTFMSSSSGSVFLSRDFKFTRQRDTIYIEQIITSSVKNTPLIIKAVGPVYQMADGPCDFQLATTNNQQAFSKDTLQWDAHSVKLPLTIRFWNEGDRFQPLGMQGSKLISDYITDKKLNPIEKQEFMVVLDSTGQIVGIPGHTISEGTKITDETTSILTLTKRFS